MFREAHLAVAIREFTSKCTWVSYTSELEIMRRPSIFADTFPLTSIRKEILVVLDGAGFRDKLEQLFHLRICEHLPEFADYESLNRKVSQASARPGFCMCAAIITSVEAESKRSALMNREKISGQLAAKWAAQKSNDMNTNCVLHTAQKLRAAGAGINPDGTRLEPGFSCDYISHTLPGRIHAHCSV